MSRIRIGRPALQPATAEEVRPYLQPIPEPREPGWHIEGNSWPTGWSPYGPLHWFEASRTLEGPANRLKKHVVGEYNRGYLEGRVIGRLVVGGVHFAYQLEPGRDYSPLEVASTGVLAYLEGIDQAESEAVTERVRTAIAESQRNHEIAVNYLLRRGLEE